MEIPRMLDGRLKFRHLLLVEALSGQGSVVGAAAALHVTQPVVTRSLQDLERILGVTLYERGPRGIRPTEFGAAFTEYARSALAQMTQASRHLQEIADATRGHVVIGTHLAGSNLLLPRAIAHVKQGRPALRIVVREATPGALLEDLVAGKIDFVVGRLATVPPEGTTQQTLHAETIRVVARSGHPLAERTEIPLGELIAYPWVLPGVETALRAELEEFFHRNDVSLPPDRVETTAFLTIRQLLVETDTVATLPELIVASDPRLTALPIPLDLVGARVGITLAAGRRLSPASEAMIQSLVAVADSVQPRPARSG
ncbi:LysR substrate-binding domain-containing protein [Amycolatopsis sp. NPDC004169]|uniref:LysR substrate-binding domain-containing protein n=1 Tax=Amycolatopsis sp. NPDC004169 TaxID=3154453 RepID=UPI0033A3BE39